MSSKKKSQNERYEEELAKAHERLYPRKKRLAHNNGSGSYSDGSLQGVNIFDQQNLVQDFGELLGVQNLDFEKPLSKSRSEHKAKQTRNFPLLQKSQKHLKYIRHNVCSASKQRAHVSTSLPEQSISRSKRGSEQQYDCQEDESYDGFYRHGIAENVKNRGRLCVKPPTDRIRPKDCDFGEQLGKHDEKNHFKSNERIDGDCKEQSNDFEIFHNKSKEDSKHKRRRKLERYEERKKLKHNIREFNKSSKKKKRKTRTCSINIYACREISLMLQYNSKVKGKLTDLTINLTSLSVKSINSHKNSLVSNSINSEPLNDLAMPVLKENALIDPKPDSQLEKCDSSPLEINEDNDMSDNDDIVVLEETSKFNVQISQICSTPNWEIKKEVITDDNSSCDMNTEKSCVAKKDEVIELSDDDEIEILEVKASETKIILNNEKVESSNTSASISAQQVIDNVETGDIHKNKTNIKISSDSMPTIEGVDKSISKLLNNLSENKVPSLSELCPVTVQSLPCKKKPDKNNYTLSLNQFIRPECKVKYDEIEDELDSNTISNILSLNPDKESTISPLIELFERESKDLQTIQYAVRNYSNVAAGLKMLEKEKLKRLQSMTYALKKLDGSKLLDQRSNPIIQNSTSTFQSAMPVQQCINNILSENVNEQFIKQAPATEQCPIRKFENSVSQDLMTSESTKYISKQNLNKDGDISISKPNSRITRPESSSEDVEIVHFLKPPPPYHSSHTMPSSSSHSKQVFSTARHHESLNSKRFESPTMSHIKRPESSQDFNKVSSIQGRFCQVCKQKAVFACQGCEKVFFCSNACGVSFWNDGHSAVC